MVQVKELGHVVLRVRDLERSIHFYRDILGMKEVTRAGDRMAFFSLGEKHHDLAVLALGPGATTPSPTSVGLYHIAFKVGDSLEELKAAREWLEQHQVNIVGEADHAVSLAIYFTDPDGNELEFYVDTDPTLWRRDPSTVATMRPLNWRRRS